MIVFGWPCVECWMLLPTRTRAFGCGWGCGDDREDDAGCWRAVQGVPVISTKINDKKDIFQSTLYSFLCF